MRPPRGYGGGLSRGRELWNTEGRRVPRPMDGAAPGQQQRRDDEAQVRSGCALRRRHQSRRPGGRGCPGRTPRSPPHPWGAARPWGDAGATHTLPGSTVAAERALLACSVRPALPLPSCPGQCLVLTHLSSVLCLHRPQPRALCSFCPAARTAPGAAATLAARPIRELVGQWHSTRGR